MLSIHYISTVARYEARTLRRSWFFRLFSIGSLVIFTFMNIGVFSPVGEEDWELVSLPASLPLINLYLLNIGQSLIVIFLAADFLKRDKKLDTNEVLYTRPMSNFEYIAGKTLGILRLFLALNLVILAIALIINIISTSMSVDILSYLAYLLIITVPTIVFSLGLAFTMMSVIRNQAITFLLLLGLAFLNMFYLWFRVGSIFDYMAFGLPVFKSGMIGFENISRIINQRLLYFSLGIALVLLTILLFKRLPQSKLHTSLSIFFLITFTAIAALCGWNTWSVYSESVQTKKLAIETARRYETTIFTRITNADIELSHKGNTIEATAKLNIMNSSSEPVSNYVFSLNPSLEVKNITMSGRNLEFSRTGQIIDIIPEKELLPGTRDSLIITYSGGISEPYCYPNYSDNIKENPYRVAMVNVRKRQAFLQDDYVLLTPETHWYPVAGLNYYPSNPARIKIDFTKYTLKVKEEEGVTAVSQGRKSSHGGYSIFTPEDPLTGLTLAMGNYVSDTLTVDSVKYITFYFPGNDYYKGALSLLGDTLPYLVSGMMRDLETNFSSEYPFKTLSLVDVPVQFHSYPRSNTQTRAEVQPSMILLPEKMSMLRYAGFKKDFTQQKKRMERENQVITEKELQLRLFNSFMRNTFISGENQRYVNGQPVNEPIRYRLGPSFYFFRNNFHSDKYPVINAVFESHLQQLVQQAPRGNWQEYMGALPDIDRANLILKKLSFEEVLRKNPGGDTLRLVVGIKGDWLFNLLRSKTGIEEFNKWFKTYSQDHVFKSVDLIQFDNDLNQKFGFSFYNLLDNWFLKNEQPGFIINNLRVTEIVLQDRSRYQVTFDAANTEAIPGLFNVSFRTGGGSAAGGGSSTPGGEIAIQGRGMETGDISRIIALDSMQAKRIGILMDFQPRAMSVNTIFSKNIPGQFTLAVDEIIKAKSGIKPFEGEELIIQRPRIAPNEIIVDNEDDGFRSGTRAEVIPLRKLLGVKNSSDLTYLSTPRTFNIPEHWQPVVSSSNYGKHVMSAVYTKPGTGDRTASWSASIEKPGYYDIYCYIGKSVNRIVVTRGSEGSGSGQRNQSTFRDIHYKIHHDEGVEDITIDYENADGGWNNLGRYYLSGDSARVEITNQTSGRAVIGDAIRWVRQE
jgi:ABC-type transport system involved in multi-copper enzyme maturation permease subunit